MPDFTNEYVATLSDAQGNYCHAIMALVQTGSTLEGRFAFGIYTGSQAPDGWQFPAADALVEGEVLDTGATAQLRVGDRAWHVTLVAQPVQGLVLQTKAEPGALPWPQFTHDALDLGNSTQTTNRLRLIDGWLADGPSAAVRQLLETWRQPVAAYLEFERTERIKHLAIEPRTATLHKDYSGSYSFTRDHSYTGNEMTGRLRLEQSGSRITGSYQAPAPAPFVSWDLPLEDGPVAGEVFADRTGWDFATATSWETWHSNEHRFALPGGPLEARIEFCGRTYFVLKTGDDCLLLSKSDSIVESADCWYPA